MSFTDVQFGSFKLNPLTDKFEGEATWDGAKVKLELGRGADDESIPQGSLASAKLLWASQVDWDKRIREFMVRELLKIKNDYWLAEDENPLSNAEFLERVTLETISAGPGEVFEFWYDDGDIFWGHVIQVGAT